MYVDYHLGPLERSLTTVNDVALTDDIPSGMGCAMNLLWAMVLHQNRHDCEIGGPLAQLNSLEMTELHLRGQNWHLQDTCYVGWDSRESDTSDALIQKVYPLQVSKETDAAFSPKSSMLEPIGVLKSSSIV